MNQKKETICEGCQLFYRSTDSPVCIPPPSIQIKGCIISRDPTSAFLQPLKEYVEYTPNHRRNFFQKEAPPCWLYKRIRSYMNYHDDSPEMKRLHHFLNFECYWTHFHKCPTEKTKKHKISGLDVDFDKKYPSFKYLNAVECANRRFEYEFEKYQLYDKIVIVLGRHLQKYFLKGPGAKILLKDDYFYEFPHPAPTNCGLNWSWNRNKPDNDRNRRSIETNIIRLLKQIGT